MNLAVFLMFVLGTFADQCLSLVRVYAALGTRERDLIALERKEGGRSSNSVSLPCQYFFEGSQGPGKTG